MKTPIFLGMAFALLGSFLFAKDSLDLAFTEIASSSSFPSKAVLIDGAGTLATVAVVGVDASSAVYTSPDGKEHRLKVILHDDVSRLTLLKLPAELVGDLEIVKSIGQSDSLEPADPVFTSVEEGASVSRFVSHDKRYEGKVLPLILCRVNYEGVPPRPGTPIFDKDRHLIGLAHQSVKGTSHTAYALPIEALERLTVAKADKAMATRCWVGISMDPSNDALTVTSVRPSSPGGEAGIRTGDILISINGKSLGDYAEVVNAFFYLVPNQTVKFVILRGTKLVEVNVTPEINPTYQP